MLYTSLHFFLIRKQVINTTNNRSLKKASSEYHELKSALSNPSHTTVIYNPFRYVQSVPICTIRSVMYNPFRYVQFVRLCTIRNAYIKYVPYNIQSVLANNYIQRSALRYVSLNVITKNTFNNKVIAFQAAVHDHNFGTPPLQLP